VQLLTKKELPSLDLPKIRKNKDIEMYYNQYSASQSTPAALGLAHTARQSLREAN